MRPASLSRRIGQRVTCSIQTGKALVEADLHPATGGDGTFACSGDMLLQALVACAGVTSGPWRPQSAWMCGAALSAPRAILTFVEHWG